MQAGYKPVPLPPSVNFHLWRPCNMRCRFCYATFEPKISHRERSLDEEQCVEVVERLADAGVEKLTFAGGEPTLCPWLERCVRTAKARGMTTMLVTNGTDSLDWAMASDRPLDWVALSIDSANSATNVAVGRSVRSLPLERDRMLELVERLCTAGVRIKLNTVVTCLNVDEDMSALVREIRPERWKILQVVPVAGQNDGRIEELLVSRESFARFVDRHRSLADIDIVPETNDDIPGSYAMVDPAGRFFDSATGEHRYSRPILEVGVAEAWATVMFSAEKYERRGARYDWTTPLVQLRTPPKLVAFTGKSGAGKDTAAEVLTRRGYRRVAVIDPLKHALQATLGLSDAQLWGAQRNTRLPDYGCTPRALFQLVSDPVRWLAPNFWVDRWRERVTAELGENHPVVSTDIRTRTEFEAARALGAVVVKIVRPGAGAPGVTGRHSTETELDEVPDTEFDAVVVNDGSPAELHAQVLEALAGRSAIK